MTVPNGNTPPGKEPADYFHGTGSIFTVIPEDGTILAVKDARGPGGSDKKVFYRLPIGDDLSVTVIPFENKRLSDPARVRPTPGQEEFVYQVFGIWFPSEGCWKISASTSRNSLAIVVNVEFVSAYEATPSDENKHT